MLDEDFRAGYLPTAAGVVHWRETGDGAALIVLHQAASSSREFVALGRRLAGHLRVIAPDLPGHGASGQPAEASVAGYAAGVAGLADGLGIERFRLLGHHAGGVVAVEVAAALGDRVEHLFLSNTPFLDAAGRALREGSAPRSYVPDRPDGAHLTEWWGRRRPIFPDDIPLLNRFLAENLLLGERVELLHRAIAEYRMEDRFPRYGGPVDYIFADADPYAAAEFDRAVAAFAPREVARLQGGTIAVMDERPDEVAGVVLGTLEGVGTR